jgi:hypothetical protein
MQRRRYYCKHSRRMTVLCPPIADTPNKGKMITGCKPEGFAPAAGAPARSYDAALYCLHGKWLDGAEELAGFGALGGTDDALMFHKLD